jgi:Ran GTPase-activating protein (RanGAP) involved in mRNA processing and transport
MITTENISLSDPLSNILKIKDDDNVLDKNSEISKPETPKRIQVPHSSSDFLTAWVDKLTANALSSLYILPFRDLNSDDFTKLFNAIANCTSLNVLTISGHDFGLECHKALTRALATNASIITLDIGSNVLGLSREEIETLTASNSVSINSDVEDSASSTPTLRKESNLSALFSGSGNSTPTPSSSNATTNVNSCLNSNATTTPNPYLSHNNSDMTLVPPSPPSPNDPNTYKQYSTSTPSFIHQVSSALSRNLKSYTQTQSYLSSSQGIFNQHKKNIAKNHLYHNNQNPILPSTESGENDINEPDNLESFKAICSGIGMNQSIQHWNLDYKSIGIKASEILADRVLLYNNTLVKLSLARNHLGDKGCIAICQALIKSRNNTLKYLNLKDNDIGSEGMGLQGIAGLLKACFPADTDDDDNDTSSSGFDLNTATPNNSLNYRPKFLAMTPLPKKAKSVTISDTVDIDVAAPYLSDDSMSPFTSQPNNAIYSTSYSSTISNSSTCSIHASTCIHSGIRELDISCNPIGDEGGVLIGEALKYNTSLRELNLDNTDIGDDTIISICKSIGSTVPPTTQNEDPTESPPRCARVQHTSRLLKLSANKNHIGAKGCEALGILLEKNPRICSLSLKGNHFGDEGVKKLVHYLKISKSSQNTTSNTNSHNNSPTFTASMGIPIKNNDHRCSMGSNFSSCSSYNSNNGWAKSPASAGSTGNGWSVFGVNSISPSDNKEAEWNKRNSGMGNNLSVPDFTGSYMDGSSMNFNTLSSSSHCKNTHLSSLYLSANNITMKGFIELIQSCPYLKLLDLHKNHIRLTEKDDFSTVIKKFGLNKLQELYLSDNNMGVTDLKLICNMLHSGLTPKLEELSLTGNVSLYDDEAYEEWEERITQLEVDRPCLSITWR